MESFKCQPLLLTSVLRSILRSPRDEMYLYVVMYCMYVVYVIMYVCCCACLSVEEAKCNATFSEPCNKTGERDSDHAMSVCTDGLKR